MPLDADLRATARRLRLKFEATARTIRLDLRKPNDLMLDRDIPQSKDSIIERLVSHNLCKQIGANWAITNLGAILFANDMKDFPGMLGHKNYEIGRASCRERV